MRILAIALILLCGCQTPHDIKVKKLEEEIEVLELKVRKAKLTSTLDEYTL